MNHGWTENEDVTKKRLDDGIKRHNQIIEEWRLHDILASCDEQLASEPTNQWWKNFRQQTQERLDEIYQTLYGDDFVDDMADLRACELFRTSL